MTAHARCRLPAGRADSPRRRRCLDRPDRPLRRAAAGVRRKPPGPPRAERRHRAGAFLGFLNSLPNYDGRRPLESYLFSICAYKLTDHLRREGRRPAVPLSAACGLVRRLGSRRQRPPGQQHRPQRRAEEPGREGDHRSPPRADRPLAREGRMDQAAVCRAALRPRLGEQGRGRGAGHHRAASRQLQVRLHRPAADAGEEAGIVGRGVSRTV